MSHTHNHDMASFNHTKSGDEERLITSPIDILNPSKFLFEIDSLENGYQLRIVEIKLKTGERREPRDYIFYKFSDLCTWLKDYVIPSGKEL